MIKKEKLCSIILDGSDDRRGRHFLSVSIFHYIGDVPESFFYRVIDVSNNMTAQGLLASLSEAFEQDGLTLYMKKLLFGIATDGASVIATKKNSFDSLLKKHLNRNDIVSIWCAAHKLNHITSHLRWPTLIGPTITRIETFINRIAGFYHGSKMLSHLKLTANSYVRNRPSLSIHVPSRWMASETRAA